MKYGWKPDVPDLRDRMAAPPPAHFIPPPHVDLRAACPPVYNQGQLGSCTANAIAAAVQYERKRQGLTPDFIPSRLFIYYNERQMEGTIDSDAGAMIRDGIKSIARLGVCHEEDWPYSQPFTAQPSPACYADAVTHKTLDYWRVPRDLLQMRGCLAAGFPFAFGFSVYESFEGPGVAANGLVSMPLPTEKMLGGHAVLAVGYDDSSQRFIVRNSWGSSWGDAGHFHLPYAFLTDPNLSDDFWCVKLESV